MLQPDEGYFFGIGAFETIAVEEGKPMFLEEHYARLLRAMEFLGLTSSIGEIRAQVERALGKTELKTGRKALKLTVSGKNIVVNSRENTYGTEDYERGFTCDYSQVRRNETSAFTYHKTLNYGDCLFEKRLAKASGIDEPIFLNGRKELCEGATTNVFFVKQGEIFTPPVSAGLLPGILREFILRRYPVTERVILPQDVEQFDEMFLTNSLLGVMFVKRLGNKIFSAGETGKRLQEEYRQFCKEK